MQLTPYVRFAMHHVWLENYYINRSIWDHEIIFIEHGSMKITIDGKVYIAKENDCVLLRPKVQHTIEWNGENCSQPHVHFDFFYQDDSESVGISQVTINQMTSDQKNQFRKDFYLENVINMPYILHLKNPIQVKTLIYNIIDEFTYKKKYSEYYLQGLMIELIGAILRENSLSEAVEEKAQQLNDIIIFMNENVDNNLTLDDFADKLHVSKWTLIQIFNYNFHCTPIKYYNKLKYLRAKDLLEYSFLHIHEISEKMHYEEPQTFSRWFKGMDGNYPNHYRKKRK